MRSVPVPMVLPCREAWCPNYQPCPNHPIKPFGIDGGQPMPPGWAEQRLACLRAARFRCQRCGQPATDAHHVHGRGSDVLEALCKSCHLKETGRVGGLSGF